MGDAAPVLVEISRGLDLLVLGSRAHSSVRRILLGGVSSDVLHGARCPVVVFSARGPRCGGRGPL